MMNPSARWYIKRHDKPYGPLTKKEFSMFIELGHLRVDDQVRTETTEYWKAATHYFKFNTEGRVVSYIQPDGTAEISIGRRGETGPLHTKTYFTNDQKRLLSIDGGGIMGLISLGVLQEMENQLRTISGGGERFRLCDFFDYFAGTSSGAIIASGLALGKSVKEISGFFRYSGEEMFDKAPLYKKPWFTYSENLLEKKLKEVIGTETVSELLESNALKSYLLIVLRNVTTDSPWPISTNPQAKFNRIDSYKSNLNIPLWQIIRASTAAPTFFKPEIIKIGDETFMFEDGAITPYNNPAFLLYKKAILPEYALNWEQGEDKLILISVGTGLRYRLLENANPFGENMIETARTVPHEIMRGISVENDINCRTIGRCVHGNLIDQELGDLIQNNCLEKNLGKKFLYVRYDVDISQDGLKEIGLPDINSSLLQIDSVNEIPNLERIGIKAAEQVDCARHFGPFLDYQTFKFNSPVSEFLKKTGT